MIQVLKPGLELMQHEQDGQMRFLKGGSPHGHAMHTRISQKISRSANTEVKVQAVLPTSNQKARGIAMDWQATPVPA